MMHMIYRTIVTCAAMFSLLLGSWHGHVALFTSCHDGPIEVYPVRLELLPRTDQDLLRNRIPVSSPDELSHILEDLLS